jgi:hypothetical protein
MFEKTIIAGNKYSTEYWEKWQEDKLVYFRVTIFHESGWVEIAPRSERAVELFKELKYEIKRMERYGFQHEIRHYADTIANGERLAIRHKELTDNDVKKIVEVLLY